MLVFCFFNFRKRAKCFAGDVGSLSIAFIIVFALGKLILQAGDFTYIVFLALYGVDSVLTICHRILLHENLGKAHRKHAYQLMANELKIPHVVVSSFLYDVTIARLFRFDSVTDESLAVSGNDIGCVVWELFAFYGTILSFA